MYKLDDISTDELRQFCASTGPGDWHHWSRDQLVAFCLNRRMLPILATLRDKAQTPAPPIAESP